MKNRIYLIALAFLLNSNGFSQTYASYSISYEYFEIVEYSIQFSYSSSGSYQSYAPYVSSQYALATLQARYDYNYARVSKEWGKLLSLKLVNDANEKTFYEWQTYIDTYIRNNSSNIDWSSYSTTDSWLTFITQPYQIASIAAEIKLLQEINYEIIRLKYEKPGEYHKTERYKELGEVLTKLETCGSSEISQLAWDHGLK